MYIIILGGENDKQGNLSNTAKKRLEKFFEVYELYKTHNPKIIISGGIRFSQISHCSIVKKTLLDKYPNLQIEKEFIQNDNTVAEAINLANYFRNIDYSDKVIIITSNYHMTRVKYLFNITFKSLNKIEIDYIETNETLQQTDIEEEKTKLYNLKNKPYGTWLNYINETSAN